MSKNDANDPPRRAGGRWAKNTSGNPSGRHKRADASQPGDPNAPAESRPAVTDPRFDVGELLGHPGLTRPRAEILPPGRAGRRGVVRKDDWRNSLTGQGIAGRDKRMGGFFAPVILSFDQLRDLCLGDHLARTAVEMIPKEAKRPGYDVTIADEGANDTDGDDIGQKIQAALKTIKADHHIELGGRYARLYGGGATLLGVNDKETDLTKPLDLDKVVSLDWLTTFEARECIPVYSYGNPSAPQYGEPEIYRITSRTVLPSYNTQYGASVLNVHESRLLIFDGVRVSRYQATGARMGWGESILTAIWTVLRDFNTAWSSAGVLVSDFAQTVIKMSGLWATLAEDDGQSYEDRLTAMDAGRSTTNSIVIDAADSFERQQTPLSGLPDLLEKFAVRLAAACGMPLTLLFGTSPAGMSATGESDIRFFYDRVDEYRQTAVDPALRKLIQILFRTIGNKKEPKKWSLNFRPLWQESPKEIATAMLTQAQADNTWIQAQVISPEEVANSHWGQGGKYNPHLSLDHEARDAQATDTGGVPSAEDLAAVGRTPAPAGDPAATAAIALNGAQVSSMVDVVKAAVMGEIPRESAQAIIAAAFPGVTSAEAEKMLGPVGFKAGSTPSAKAVAAVEAIAAPAPTPPSTVDTPEQPSTVDTPEQPATKTDAGDRSKDALLRTLSPNGRCAACNEPGAIEVDHVDGRDWSPRALSKTQRTARYWDELDQGVKLRALCRSCNASDGAKNKQKRDEDERADAEDTRTAAERLDELDALDSRLDALEAALNAETAE